MGQIVFTLDNLQVSEETKEAIQKIIKDLWIVNDIFRPVALQEMVDEASSITFFLQDLIHLGERSTELLEKIFKDKKEFNKKRSSEVYQKNNIKIKN